MLVLAQALAHALAADPQPEVELLAGDSLQLRPRGELGTLAQDVEVRLQLLPHLLPLGHRHGR